MAFSLPRLPKLMPAFESMDKPTAYSRSEYPSITSPRSLRQFSLFCAGSTFFALSVLITRRAVVRRYAATIPRFYRPSNEPTDRVVNGPLEAVEALSLATLNVTSFMLMMAGGALWAFDISTAEEMRRKIPRRTRPGGSERLEQEAEQELEVWLAEKRSWGDDKGSTKSAADDEGITDQNARSP